MIHQSVAGWIPMTYLPTAMSIGSSNGAGGIRDTLTATPARRQAILVGAVIAATVGILAGWIATRLLLRWFRTARNTARFAYAVATFGAFRRCHDCKRLVRADAKVCSHCGYRKPVKTSSRARKAQRQAATVA
jgi:hypothetical protein